MFIKMIRDKDNLKKGNTYNFDNKKANALLTAGFCVRAKEKAQETKAAAEMPATDEQASKRKK